VDNSNHLSSDRASSLLFEEVKIVEEWARGIDFGETKKILVKGASGFIGQWLLVSLQSISSNLGKFEVFAETSRPEILRRNWGNNYSEKFKPLNQFSGKFDLIFDFSLPPTGPSTGEQILQAKEFFWSVISCAQLANPGAKIIHPSSGAVYGNFRFQSDLCEDLALSASKLSIYGEAKLAIESATSSFKAYGVQLITPRIFSVYGPLMREDSPLVGNVFIRTSAKGESIKATRTKNVFRDFIFITDLIKQIIHTAVSENVLTTLNLGSENILELNHFGELVADLAGVAFAEGAALDKTDNYFGCLHHLKSTNSSLVENCQVPKIGIAKTLSYLRSTL